MTSWIESPEHDPYRNLAIEEQLLGLCDNGPILYLWQNERTVVIGRNQDPARECRAALLEAEGGHLARRLSGGGAVYHDLGNLNFSFLARRADYDMPKQLEVVCRAVGSFGLHASFSGRNDLEIGGWKFSGNAFYERDSRCCHHGTVMVDVDREALDRYLTVPEKKLASRGVASVQARVVDLRELAEDVTVEELKAALLAAFAHVYGKEPRRLDLSALDADRLAAGETRFRDRAWIYGRWSANRRQSMEYDLIVIGGGPGGYTAAVRAAKLGMRAALVERRELGGMCLNRGCIPTAAMLHSAGLCRQLRESERFGIRAAGVSVDYAKLLAYRQETVRTLVQGVEQMLDLSGVARLSGTGTLLPDKRVRVASEDGETVLAAKNILLATGSKARVPDIPGVDLPGVTDSDGALAWESIPDSLTVIGGGVIGVEYAQIFADLGSHVTLLGTRARLLPSMDREIGQSLKMVLKKRDVDVRTGVTVERIEQKGELLRCRFAEKDREVAVTSSRVLYAVGRVPYTDGLFEGEAPEMEGGSIAVNGHFETSIPGIYAIGDVIGGPQLAHLAMAQGTAAAERMAGLTPSVDVDTVPYCVYTDPEIVSVGLTEAAARDKNIPVHIGKCVLGGNGRSVVSREERGFMRLVTDGETGRLLGAQLMCARAGEMAGELVSAISNGFTARQLRRAVRPHPTYNESLSEALRALD